MSPFSKWGRELRSKKIDTTSEAFSDQLKEIFVFGSLSICGTLSPIITWSIYVL